MCRMPTARSRPHRLHGQPLPPAVQQAIAQTNKAAAAIAASAAAVAQAIGKAKAKSPAKGGAKGKPAGKGTNPFATELAQLQFRVKDACKHWSTAKGCSRANCQLKHICCLCGQAHTYASTHR